MSKQDTAIKDISGEWKDFLSREEDELDDKTLIIFAKRLATMVKIASSYNKYGSIFDNIIKQRVDVLLKYLRDNNIPGLSMREKDAVIKHLENNDIDNACCEIIKSAKDILQSSSEKHISVITMLSWVEWMELILADVSMGHSAESIQFYDFIEYIRTFDLRLLKHTDLHDNMEELYSAAHQINDFKLKTLFPLCVQINEFIKALV